MLCAHFPLAAAMIAAAPGCSPPHPRPAFNPHEWPWTARDAAPARIADPWLQLSLGLI